MGRDENLANAHAVDPAVKGVDVDRVAIPEEIPWGRFVGEHLNDLLGGPGGGRVVRDIAVPEFPPVMAEDDEGEEELEGEGGNEEEVDRKPSPGGASPGGRQLGEGRGDVRPMYLATVSAATR